MQGSTGPQEAAADEQEAALQTDVACFMAAIAEAQNQPLTTNANQPPLRISCVAPLATSPSLSSNASARCGLAKSPFPPASSPDEFSGRGFFSPSRPMKGLEGVNFQSYRGPQQLSMSDTGFDNRTVP